MKWFCDLDLRVTDPKINRGHLAPRTIDQIVKKLDKIFKFKGTVTLSLKWPLTGYDQILCTLYVDSMPYSYRTKFNRWKFKDLKLKVKCDLDLRLTESKINRGHLMAKTSLCSQYEDSKPNSYQVVERTMIFSWRSLWHWPLNDLKIYMDHLMTMINLYIFNP